MSFSKKLLNNSIIYAIGNFGSKIFTLLLAPILSFYLTKTEFGLYDLIMSTLGLLFPILTLQLSQGIYRFIIDNTIEETKKYISSGIFIIFIIFLISIYPLYLLSIEIEFQYFEYFILILIGSVFFPFFQQIVRATNKVSLYAQSGILYTLSLCLITIFNLYILELGFIGLLIAIILAYFIVLIFILLKSEVYKLISINAFDKNSLQELFKYSLPLIPNALSWFLITISNKYLILMYLGIDENGIFALSSKFPSIIAVISSVFMMAWQDFVIKEETNQKTIIFATKLFNQIVIFYISFLIFITPASKLIVDYFVSDTFNESYKYMPLLFLSAALSSLSAFVGTLYLKEKATNALFSTTVVGGVLNVLITYLLLPTIGLYAPALGSALSFLLVLLLRIRKIKSIYPVFKFGSTSFVLSIILVGYSFLMYFYTNEFILSIFAFLILAFVNKTVIKQIFHKLFKMNKL